MIFKIWLLGCLWKFSKISPTSPKFNTHKKVVVHFFIPMLLLPKTPPLTYPNMKRFKGPKMDSLHFTFFHFSLHFTSLHFHKHGGRRSIAGIKESFEGYRPPTPMVIKEIPFKCSTCKTSAGVYASIFQRNPFKNFFHIIFFPGKSLVKNLKITFNFTWKSF